jgi:hypothetical protein
LSGVLYQVSGVSGSLWGAVVLAGAAGVVAFALPPVAAAGTAWSGATPDE